MNDYSKETPRTPRDDEAELVSIVLDYPEGYDFSLLDERKKTELRDKIINLISPIRRSLENINPEQKKYIAALLEDSEKILEKL